MSPGFTSLIAHREIQYEAFGRGLGRQVRQFLSTSPLDCKDVSDSPNGDFETTGERRSSRRETLDVHAAVMWGSK